MPYFLCRGLGFKLGPHTCTASPLSLGSVSPAPSCRLAGGNICLLPLSAVAPLCTRTCLFCLVVTQYPLADLLPPCPSLSSPRPWQAVSHCLLLCDQLSYALHMREIMQCLPFWVWFISLNIMNSSSSHVVVNSGISFLLIMLIYYFMTVLDPSLASDSLGISSFKDFVSYLCMYLHVGMSRGQTRVSDPPGTRVTDSCECLCGCWELKPGPL